MTIQLLIKTKFNPLKMTEKPNFDFLRDQPLDANPYPWSASEYVRRQQRSDEREGERTFTAVVLGLGLAGIVGMLTFCYAPDSNVELPSTPAASQLELQAYD
jgi:hypothetical protein